MRVLMAQVYNPKNEALTDIGLPASFEEMEDALHIINTTAKECTADIHYFLGDFNPLENKTVQPCSLYELNYFATLFGQLQEYEQLQFIGLVECTDTEYPEMKEVINLALNVPKLDCHHAPATTDKEIGEIGRAHV